MIFVLIHDFASYFPGPFSVFLWSSAKITEVRFIHFQFTGLDALGEIIRNFFNSGYGVNTPY
jgi:hypothetical protein